MQDLSIEPPSVAPISGEGDSSSSALPSYGPPDITILDDGPWPLKCEMDAEVINTQPIAPYSQGWLTIYRDRYMFKTAFPGPDIEREITMTEHAGECAVRVVGKVYCRGELLGFIMPLEKPLEVPTEMSRRLAMMDEMVDLLARLHAKDIIHGDVNLSNMLLCSDGKIRFCDFGNSAFEQDAFVPRACTMLSCSQYKWKNDRAPWTKADDLYSLGTALYHLVTGHRPYPDVEDDDVEDEIAAGRLPDLSVIEDERARGIIARCLHAVPKWDGKYLDLPTFEELEKMGRTHQLENPFRKIILFQEGAPEGQS